LLLRSGADIDALNANGDSPLLCAIGAGNIATVKKLIQMGASRCGSLVYAAELGEIEIYKYLQQSRPIKVRMALKQVISLPANVVA
jgi:hypothetical protein